MNETLKSVTIAGVGPLRLSYYVDVSNRGVES